MYILLVIPATWKHYVGGIEPSYTQKCYNLNLPYEDTSSSWPEILHIEAPKSRQLSFKLHWGNMTCKREEAIALKFNTSLLPMSFRVIWKEEMADVSAAHGDRWGAPRRSRRKKTKEASMRLNGVVQITHKNKSRWRFMKSCTCCNPLRPCCLSKFLHHSVQHEDKSCSYV